MKTVPLFPQKTLAGETQTGASVLRDQYHWKGGGLLHLSEGDFFRNKSVIHAPPPSLGGYLRQPEPAYSSAQSVLPGLGVPAALPAGMGVMR